MCQLCQEEKLPRKVMSSCLLCVSELCRSLGPHTIPLLPSLLPTVLQQLGGAEDKTRCVCDDYLLDRILTAQRHGRKVKMLWFPCMPYNMYRSDSLQLSAANCLATVTETLPKFLSSFIIDIITTVL